jgi:hypothetical protein
MAFAPTDILFDEILEFLVSSLTAQEIIDFSPPVTLQQRLEELLDKNRISGLCDNERHELAEFMSMNRFMSRLKLKARARV